MSGIYIKDNVQSFPDVEVYTTTDDTYRPPGPSSVHSTVIDTASDYTNEEEEEEEEGSICGGYGTSSLTRSSLATRRWNRHFPSPSSVSHYL